MAEGAVALWSGDWPAWSWSVRVRPRSGTRSRSAATSPSTARASWGLRELALRSLDGPAVAAAGRRKKYIGEVSEATFGVTRRGARLARSAGLALVVPSATVARLSFGRAPAPGSASCRCFRPTKSSAAGNSAAVIGEGGQPGSSGLWLGPLQRLADRDPVHGGARARRRWARFICIRVGPATFIRCPVAWRSEAGRLGGRPPRDRRRPASCRDYELFAAYPHNGGKRWSAGSGRPTCRCKFRSAGLPILPGWRLQRGHHGAIECTAKDVYPARHVASNCRLLASDGIARTSQARRSISRAFPTRRVSSRRR